MYSLNITKNKTNTYPTRNLAYYFSLATFVSLGILSSTYAYENRFGNIVTKVTKDCGDNVICMSVCKIWSGIFPKTFNYNTKRRPLIKTNKQLIDCAINDPDAILASTGRSWDDPVSAIYLIIKVGRRSSFGASVFFWKVFEIKIPNPFSSLRNPQKNIS